MLKRGLIAGAVLLILGFVINRFVGLVLPQVVGEYQNLFVFRPWSDPLMTVYFAYPFVLGVAASYLWGVLKAKNPMHFARLYFVVATIPGMFVTWTSMQVTLLMVLVWAVTGFVQIYIAGVVFTKVK